jgi:hypothetical protein
MSIKSAHHSPIGGPWRRECHAPPGTGTCGGAAVSHHESIQGLGRWLGIRCVAVRSEGHTQRHQPIVACHTIGRIERTPGARCGRCKFFGGRGGPRRPLGISRGPALRRARSRSRRRSGRGARQRTARVEDAGYSVVLPSVVEAHGLGVSARGAKGSPGRVAAARRPPTLAGQPTAWRGGARTRRQTLRGRLAFGLLFLL